MGLTLLMVALQLPLHRTRVDMVVAMAHSLQRQLTVQEQQQAAATVQAAVEQTLTTSRGGMVEELGQVLGRVGMAVLVVAAMGLQEAGQQHTRQQHLQPALCGLPCRMTRAAPTTTTPPTDTASGRSLQTCHEEVNRKTKVAGMR